MRLVQWENKDGLLVQAYVRDGDPDELAESVGILHMPPDLDNLDWDGIKRDLHNELIKRGIVTWNDVQKQQAALTNVITATLKRRLVALYRQQAE